MLLLSLQALFIVVLQVVYLIMSYTLISVLCLTVKSPYVLRVLKQRDGDIFSSVVSITRASRFRT